MYLATQIVQEDIKQNNKSSIEPPPFIIQPLNNRKRR